MCSNFKLYIPIVEDSKAKIIIFLLSFIIILHIKLFLISAFPLSDESESESLFSSSLEKNNFLI